MLSRIRSGLNVILLLFFKMEKCFVFEKELPDPSFEVKAKIEVDVKVVQSDDIPIVSKTFEDFATYAKERFEKGCICFGAISNEKFVHLKWFGFHEMPVVEIDRQIWLSPDSAYLFGSFTVPDYRGLGIAPKVMEKAFQYLSGIGIKRVYAVQRQDNIPNLRVRQKERWRNIGSLTYIRILKFRFYKLRSATEEDYNEVRKMLFAKSAHWYDRICLDFEIETV
ncbi:MAG: GNAT family N-acetyltransferase [Candidatus Bathyarchaeota archaeon]|nr:GNAT family N-acetyltransferase [Candidatus Bathyarchaeota archaeon]